MEPLLAVDIGRQAILLVLIVSGPLLIAGLVVGLAVGVFQAVTQIHEMTLTFIPKILAMVSVLLAMLPWMIIQVIDYTIRLFELIPTITN
ncbi:MAG: flagellar biosynthesis protein FliQ [Chitinivibrionales bacterium]|nr:flagellar biosynthesis protein FliQ [Chitinivibrionales bacterium]